MTPGKGEGVPQLLTLPKSSQESEFWSHKLTNLALPSFPFYFHLDTSGRGLHPLWDLESPQLGSEKGRRKIESSQMAEKDFILATSSILPFWVLWMLEVPEGPSRGHRGAGCASQRQQPGRRSRQGRWLHLGKRHSQPVAAPWESPHHKELFVPREQGSPPSALTTPGFAVLCFGLNGRTQGRTAYREMEQETNEAYSPSW